MICYVDMEHARALRSAGEKEEHRRHCADVARRLEETSGDKCVVRRYGDLTQDWLNEMAIGALVLSGNVTDWDAYDEADLRELKAVVRGADLPILGLCGGLQFIAMVHHARMGPIRRLGETEHDPRPDYAPGYFKEWGFKPIQVLKPDPLFDGLREEPVFLEAHYWEVKEVPEGFDLLASTDVSVVQAIGQVEAPVYGVQFHPEAYVARPIDHESWLIDLVYPEGYAGRQLDGRRLLINFFRLAGIRQ